MGAAIPYIILGATVLSTVSQMQGQQIAGQAAQDQANYQAQVADNNRVIAERNKQASIDAAARSNEAAADALAIGRQEETNQRRQTNTVIGRQRAVLASNGVLVDSGSALDLTSDTRAIGEMDALTIRSNAAREALAFQDQSKNYLTQGENFSTEAQNFAAESLASRRSAAYSKIATKNAMTGTLLGGVSSVGTKWYNFSKGGAIS